MARAPLRQLLPKYRRIALKVYQGVCIEHSLGVQEGTPVDTGALRRSWTPAINYTDESNRGGNVIAIARSLTLSDRYTFTTAMPYARRIEYMGHSPQAPRGMMRVQIAKHQQVVDAQVRRYRNAA